MLERLAARPWLPLLLLAAVHFLFMLGGHSLWDVDEPNNAVCAREMLEAGNWWVPVFNGELRFDKPILLYWLMMPAYAVFGVSEFAARLPSAMAMTALTFLVWFFARRLLDAKAGLIAAVLFASALHIVVMGRAATPDPIFMLCISLAMFALWCALAETERRTPWLLAAYAAMGLGVLAKGPVAVVMPGLLILAYLGLMRRWRDIALLRPGLGLFIVLAVALPWYIAVGMLTDGEWLKGFLLHHNIERFTDALQGHRGFPGLYVLSVAAGWFPWSGLLLATVIFGPWRLGTLREQPLRLYLLCWIGVFLLFFTLARTQLPNYMLPTFPAAAVLMADWLGRAEAGTAGRWTAWGALVLALAMMLAGGVALELQWPGEWVYIISFAPVAAAAAVWLLRRQGSMLVPVTAGMTVCVVFLAAWALPAFDRHKAAPALARAADAAGFDGSALATFHYFQPSLLFYHGGRLPQLADVHAVAVWLTAGKAVVMPEEALSALPPAILPYVVVHRRVHGMYARRTLLLLSLRPVEDE